MEEPVIGLKSALFHFFLYFSLGNGEQRSFEIM